MSPLSLQPPLFPTEPTTTAVTAPPSRLPVSSSRDSSPAAPRFGFCVLGSGSGGNCSVVRFGPRAMLLDAGLGPVTVTRRLHQAGLTLSDVRTVCLTHLDRDHFRPHWTRTLIGYRIRVRVHRWHLDALLAEEAGRELDEVGLIEPFGDRTFRPLPGVRVDPIRFRHDDQGTTGFHIEGRGVRLGYATDLGCVPRELIERCAGVDVMAIESNYDPQMQNGSKRPWFLKRRIMGGAGHLSNEEAFRAVQQLMDRRPHGPPPQVVLLHRSRQCNDPKIIRRIFGGDPRLRGRLVLAEQRRRSRWIRLKARPAMEAAQASLW